MHDAVIFLSLQYSDTTTAHCTRTVVVMPAGGVPIRPCRASDTLPFGVVVTRVGFLRRPMFSDGQDRIPQH